MTDSPGWIDYMRVPVALLFVVGLIVLLSAVLKKTGFDKRITGNKGAARMSVVETLYLDPRRRLVIVREGENEHVLLLSASGDTLVATRKGSANDAG